MVADSNAVLYACVSKENTVLAEISSGDQDLETLVLKCLENVPRFHLFYTQTWEKKTYVFLMEDLFVYFAIVDEGFGKPQAIRFLERARDAFVKMLKNRSIDLPDHLTPLCLNEEFGPACRLLLQLGGETSQQSGLLESEQNGDRMPGNAQVGGVDPTGKKLVPTEVSLLGRPNKYEKISRSLTYENGEVGDTPLEDKVDFAINAETSQERGISLEKQCCFGGEGVQQRARRKWRQHVRAVLLIDFVVCCILFGVWLSICKGFHCISR